LLVAHGADQKAIDRGSGATALMLAKHQGDEDLVSLLDPSAASARQSLVEEGEEDDEPELPSELILTGNVMAIDHVLKLDAALERFDWGRYEAALAKLAGVRAVDVFVTPEPGSVCVEAHATILVRLPGSKTMPAAPTSAPTASTSSNSSIRGVMAATGGLGGKTMSSLAGGTLRATGGGAGARALGYWRGSSGSSGSGGRHPKRRRGSCYCRRKYCRMRASERREVGSCRGVIQARGFHCKKRRSSGRRYAGTVQQLSSRLPETVC
jgi:hypothetical protein